MALHDQIREYYFGQLASLPLDKQFHFASRLGAWEQHPEALQTLQRLRPHLVPDFPADGALREILQKIIATPPTTHIIAAALRAPYFKRYPTLYGAGLAMFRVRHWLAIYDIDGRDALFDAVPEEDLTKLERKLLRDPKAINFVYLYERIMLGQDDKKAIDIKKFYKLGRKYDHKKPEELRLYIYFYTHCIIADSNFYTQPVPGFALPTYIKMLKRLEKAIRGHYDQISLDNKLEFLVCCRICDFDTTLAGRIYDECHSSLSDEGTFLIDRHNATAHPDRATFIPSEHRNVLYIMSRSPYTVR
jgi:hypothetical protein